MKAFVGLAGAAVIIVVLWDAFETMILPRRVARRIRLARLFLRGLWRLWSLHAKGQRVERKRENYLSLYALLSLLLLLAVWAAGLIVGFAALQWAIGSRLVADHAPAGFLTNLYMSGTTFFTLGLGDVRPTSGAARLLTVVEAGSGFGFLALVIAYLPVLYQAFSRREVHIALLAGWAGSPPSAGELLRRWGGKGSTDLERLLAEWERWSAELLESHVSYPILAYFRSQHDKQSWLGAMTAILDLAALVATEVEGVSREQAARTFSMARHAAVDLCVVIETATPPTPPERLTSDELRELRAMLTDAGVRLRPAPDADVQLTALRRSYEPHVCALSSYLLMPLPGWLPPSSAAPP